MWVPIISPFSALNFTQINFGFREPSRAAQILSSLKIKILSVSFLLGAFGILWSLRNKSLSFIKLGGTKAGNQIRN
jgi:hypothetical protein